MPQWLFWFQGQIVVNLKGSFPLTGKQIDENMHRVCKWP